MNHSPASPSFASREGSTLGWPASGSIFRTEGFGSVHRGYVKLWRKSVDSELWGDWNAWGVWNWCLIRATHRLIEIHGRQIEPGQFVTGRNEGARECKMKPSTWLRCMKRCEEAGYLTMRADKLGTTVTLTAYHVYNEDEAEGGQGLNPQRTGVEPPADTARTQGADTKEHNTTIAQEHRNTGNTKVGAEIAAEIELPESLDCEGFRQVLGEWLRYHKPYKPQGLRAMLTRAAWRVETHGMDALISAFCQAMGNGWTGWDQNSSFTGSSGKSDRMTDAEKMEFGRTLFVEAADDES